MTGASMRAGELNAHQPDERGGRTALARLVGRVVTCEARWSNAATQLEDGSWLYHVTEAHVFPRASYEHLWIADVPMHARRRLNEGMRFSFRATVIRYTRADGSEDYSLRYESWVKG